MALEETTVGDDAQLKEDIGRDLSIWRIKLHLDGHSGGVNDVAFSNDGELLASASEDGTVRLWNTTTKKGIRKLKSSDPVTAVVFSPDGQLVASASEDNTVRLWNPITGEQLFSLERHSDVVRAVAFSPDSQLLASVSDDKTVRLWNSFTGENLQELKEHSHPVDGVAFSPDGALLASASGDRTIILWTEEAEETLQFLGFAGHDSALDAKIRTLGPGLLRMLESLKDPLLHATAIGLVEIPSGHMTFADAPLAHKLGNKAHETEIDEDD